MHTLAIHIKTSSSGLIPKACILLSYYSPEDWALVRRMLEHRRVEHQFLAKRKALPNEVKAEGHPYRIGFSVYDDWDKLIADERQYSKDKEWFNQIAMLKSKFKQFSNAQLQLI